MVPPKYLCALFALSFPALAGAATILSQTGATAVGPSISGGSASGQLLAAGWSAAGAYSNVSIDAFLSGGGACCGGPSHFTAYLMNQIGPAATLADEIAESSFTLNNGCVAGFACPGESITTIFSGLTLASGSYWLVIADLNPNEQPCCFTGGGQWYSADPSQLVTDSGVAYLGLMYAGGYNGSFPPATTLSSWPLTNGAVVFSVTGTPNPGAIPEPSTLLLAAGSIFGMLAWKGRKPIGPR